MVMGPAGVGKSTYCKLLQVRPPVVSCPRLTPLIKAWSDRDSLYPLPRLSQDHCAAQRRTVHVINLDPAAESFAYEPELDLRELVTVDDVMEEMELGPNGALVYCMEYLLDNLDWLEVRLLHFWY